MSVVSTIFLPDSKRWSCVRWEGTAFQRSEESFLTPDIANTVAAAAAGKKPGCLFSQNGQFVAIRIEEDRLCAVIVQLPQDTSSMDIKCFTVHRFPKPPTLAEIFKCALNQRLPCVPHFFGDLPKPEPVPSITVVID